MALQINQPWLPEAARGAGGEPSLDAARDGHLASIDSLANMAASHAAASPVALRPA